MAYGLELTKEQRYIALSGCADTNKRWLYTGVTRAKNTLCVVWG